MLDPKGATPKAFVIMPFGEGFDEIYGLFIASALTEVGYEVLRADDIRNQQNILKDILTGITDSTLIVADLTGSNPNVYYELGLAHALGKRVILLTQAVDELPFDLRSYRVIPYSTHFAEIVKARNQLLLVAKEAVNNRVSFGSPVTDFLVAMPSKKPAIVATLSESVDRPSGDEAGMLDYLVDMEDGFAKLGEIVEATTSEMNSISEASVDAAARLAVLAQSNSPARIRRGIIIELAARLLDYSNNLARYNEQYASALVTTRSSLESVIRAQVPSTEEERNQLRGLLIQLDQAEQSAHSQRTSLGQLIETIRSTPRIERTFNRAADAAVRNLEGYAQNVDQTLSMIVRARELTNSRLAQSS